MYFDLASNVSYSVHAGGEAIIVIIDMLTRFLTLAERVSSLPAHEAAIALLPGISVMTNLHPLFVHFPIVLLSLFFIIDTTASLVGRINWRHAAGWFLYLGTAFAGITIISGLIAAKTVPHGEVVHEIMETHEHLAILIFLLAATLSIWRLVSNPLPHGSGNFAFLGLAGFMAVLIVFTADMGGQMVYQYGVSVIPVAASTEQIEAAQQHDHEPGHAHNE